MIVPRPRSRGQGAVIGGQSRAHGGPEPACALNLLARVRGVRRSRTFPRVVRNRAIAILAPQALLLTTLVTRCGGLSVPGSALARGRIWCTNLDEDGAVEGTLGGVVSAGELDVSEGVLLRGRWLGFGWCVRAERKL